jgi:hypothetical protein
MRRASKRSNGCFPNHAIRCASTQGMKQMAVGFSSPIPLPRARPKRL